MKDPTAPMTWAEFVTQVGAGLREHGLSRDVPIHWIHWDWDAFGGVSIPDVYVNYPADADGDPAIGIGED